MGSQVHTATHLHVCRVSDRCPRIRHVCRECLQGFCSACYHSAVESRHIFRCPGASWLKCWPDKQIPRYAFLDYDPVKLERFGALEILGAKWSFEQFRRAGYFTEDACDIAFGTSWGELQYAKRLILDGTITVGSPAWKRVWAREDFTVPSFRASMLLADPTLTTLPKCYSDDAWKQILHVVEQARNQRCVDIGSAMCVPMSLARLICAFL